MEISQYFRILRRWLWLILLAAFVSGSISFLTQITQPAQYRTQTTIAIGNYLESPNPNSQEIRTGIDLAQTYAQLVRTFDVLNGVVETLDLPFGTSRLSSMIDTRILPGTSLLQISTTHTDPVLVADMTNEVARQLILQSPTNLTPAQQEQVDLLNEQVNTQTSELGELRTQLREVDANLLLDISDDARSLLVDQRNVLINQINEASANLAQFANTIASFQQRSNSVEIVESARIPTSPIGSSLLMRVMLGVLGGAALAFGGVMLYEYLNDTLHNADEVTRALNLPVLGVISKFGKKSDGYNDRLITNQGAFSKPAEEYRTLRANILYTSGKRKRVFVVSSSSPQEGKSVTAANVAVSMALSGSRVLLVDADMRRPRVHDSFKLDNKLGLSNLLTRRINVDANQSLDSDTQQQQRMDELLTADTWKRVIQPSPIPNLMVITSGHLPPNPSELLGSVLMQRWIDEFINAPNVDVVIFDTPPVLALSDSAVLAAAINAGVLLVVQAGQTRRAVVTKAKERFENVGVDILGVVLNSVNMRDEDYYGYGYGYYYTNQNPERDNQ